LDSEQFKSSRNLGNQLEIHTLTDFCSLEPQDGFLKLIYVGFLYGYGAWANVDFLSEELRLRVQSRLFFSNINRGRKELVGEDAGWPPQPANTARSVGLSVAAMGNGSSALSCVEKGHFLGSSAVYPL
jgi:hypothetical protein